MDIKTQKMLADVVLNAQKKSVQPYTTTAKVKSMADDVVYVEIPGSDRITPVKSSSVAVKKGDIVDLAVSHNDTHITGNRSDVATPQSSTKELSQAMEATRLELDNKLDLTNNKIKMVGNDIEMIDNTIKIYGSNVETLNSTVKTQGSKIDTLDSTVKTYGSNVETLGSTVETHESTIKTLDSTVKTQGSSIETLDSTVKTQGSKIDTLDSTVETQGSNIETLNSTVETQGSNIETLNSTVKTQGSSLETLDSSVRIINSAFVIQNGKMTGISEILTKILNSDYVTTDLMNADVAWIENGKIKQGAIGTVEIHDSSITTAKIAELSADVISTGTLKTECLVLTTDEIDPATGKKKVALITALNAKTKAGEDNVLDGAIIKDETIEAAKITVVDLNAFGATIGNFHIGASSMYNNKTALTDPTDGVYIGTDGIALGQGSLLDMTDDSPFRVESDGDFHLGGKNSNYLNFNAFKGKLDIDADNIKIGSSDLASQAYVDLKAEGITNTVDNVNGRLTTMEQKSEGFTWSIDETAIVSSVNEYYKSTSATSLSGGSWSENSPEWTQGTYIWIRAKNTNGKGTVTYTNPVCITGNPGEQGPKGDGLDLKDTRNDNQPPSWYIANYPETTVMEFKTCSTLSLSSADPAFCTLQTIIPWHDIAGGYPKQTAKVGENGKEYWRVGISDSEWSQWIDPYGTAIDSAKTATNYMKFSSDGLTISQNAETASTGQNVNITEAGVNIRNGSEVLASYGKKIVLKNNGEDAFIVSSSSRIASLRSMGREKKFESYTSNVNYFEGIIQTTNPDYREIFTPNGWFFQHPASKYYMIFNIEESIPVTSNPFYLDKIRLYEEDRTEYDVYTKIELYLRQKNSAGIFVDTVKKVPLYCCDENAMSKVEVSGSLHINNNSDVNGLIYGDSPFSIGDLEGTHLEMDGNEIMAKANEESPGSLYLNKEGGTVFVNSEYDRGIKIQYGAILSKNSGYYKDEGWLTLFDGLDDSGNTSFGHGNYVHKIGETGFYGNKIKIVANTDIDIKPGSKKVNCNSNIYLDNNMVIYGKTENGTNRSNFQPVNSSGNCILGWGNYSAKNGYTNIYGHGINLNTSNYLKSNRELNLLWSGGLYMGASHVASLSEKVSDQLNGIVLVWSKYANGEQNYEWNSFFIPKQMVTEHPGGGHAMYCLGVWPSYKYVYINDNSITGAASNNSTTNKINGVNVDSTNHVLRYVIGV